jgi:hypothetical protein
MQPASTSYTRNWPSYLIRAARSRFSLLIGMHFTLLHPEAERYQLSVCITSLMVNAHPTASDAPNVSQLAEWPCRSQHPDRCFRPSSATLSTVTITHFQPPSMLYPGLLLPDDSETGHFLFFFPHFLWAHRSGNSSPLRPTRLLLCRFRPQQHWVPSNKADASLRLHAPSLFAVPQTKRGRKKR